MATTSSDAREALGMLSKALRDVHRALVNTAKKEYEREWGPVSEGGQLLQLLTRHPQFDWLHHLSELMVIIDELMDEETVSEADRCAVFAQTKSLIAPSETDSSDFSRRYITLLQHDPILVMAHAHVQRILASRPA